MDGQADGAPRENLSLLRRAPGRMPTLVIRLSQEELEAASDAANALFGKPLLDAVTAFVAHCIALHRAQLAQVDEARQERLETTSTAVGKQAPQYSSRWQLGFS